MAFADAHVSDAQRAVIGEFIRVDGTTRAPEVFRTGDQAIPDLAKPAHHQTAVRVERGSDPEGDVDPFIRALTQLGRMVSAYRLPLPDVFHCGAGGFQPFCSARICHSGFFEAR